MIPLKCRTPQIGPERDLVESFINYYKSTKSGKYEIFLEPNIPTGFPDIVIVRFSAKGVDSSRLIPKLTQDHIKLLHLIYQMKGSQVGEVLNITQQNSNKAKAMIDKLHDLDLIYFRGSKVYNRALKKIFPVTQIIAIEAKISDLSSSIRQAELNRWFASHSYILIPSRLPSAVTVEKAQSAGVGILHSYDNNFLTKLRPVVHRLPASFGSWLFLFWLVSCSTGGGHAKRNIRPI